MKFLSTKLKEILLGSADEIDGGTPLRSQISSPMLDGTRKYYYWEGNKGLLVSLLERIEKLEKEIENKKGRQIIKN